MKKITLFVNKKKFIDWYFDEGTCDSVIDILIEKGKVTLKDCLKGVGYLPLNVIVNKGNIRASDVNREDAEIEEPGQIYDLKFKE